MKYRALITMDWGKPHNNNARHKLISALMDADWLLVETSTFTIETEEINKVWRGVGLIAKGAAATGVLTALSLNVIGSEDFSTTKEYKAKKSHPKALQQIEALPFPT